MKNYSDDNCICKAETINPECPRHKRLLKHGTDADQVRPTQKMFPNWGKYKKSDYEVEQEEKAEADRY